MDEGLNKKGEVRGSLEEESCGGGERGLKKKGGGGGKGRKGQIGPFLCNLKEI